MKSFILYTVYCGLFSGTLMMLLSIELNLPVIAAFGIFGGLLGVMMEKRT